MILRLLRAYGRKFSAHSVNTLTEFLHIIVSFQILGYLGIAGEVGVADIICADDTRQFTRCLKHKAVVKHLYLNLRALDAVIAVTDTIHRHLLYHELWIFSVGLEETVLAQIGMFFHLGLEVFNGLLYLVENAPLKGDILDDVHLSSDFLLCAIVFDETDTSTGKEVLRTLAKEQNASVLTCGTSPL